MNEDSTERAAIEVIHSHCAIFTQPEVARGILDFVGWTADRNLTEGRLLEPSCGDGSFLVPAVERLLESAKRRGALHEVKLAEKIVAFEFDARTAALTRGKVEMLLLSAGLGTAAAARLAAQWVRCQDFLLSRDLGVFSHVVGNPPYMRWSKLPRLLRQAYESKLPSHAARGDLCLSFVWRAASLLETKSGRVAFLCADRWLRCAYGEVARAELAKKVRVAFHIPIHALPVFLCERKVGAYAAITVLDRKIGSGSVVAQPSTIVELQRRLRRGVEASTKVCATSILASAGGAVLADSRLAALFERMSAKTARLATAGVSVRCGMALGAASAFIVGSDSDIEPDRLVPFLRANDLAEDGTATPVKRLANVWAPDGALVDLHLYPRLKDHLEKHRAVLEDRVCVISPQQWYRTIDRANCERLAAPKILVAGMAKVSRVAWSPGGAQLSNALYAVTSSEWPLFALYALFRTGILDVFAAVLAPKFSGGSMRFDGNVLGQVRIPLWSSIDHGLRRTLENMDATIGLPRPDLIAELYGVRSIEHRKALAAATARPSPAGTLP